MLPLITRDDFEQNWIYTDKEVLSVGDVLFRAKQLSEQLPEHQYCLLLSEQRVNFIIGFLAAIWRGQTILLPPNRSAEVSRSLLSDYSDICCLQDGIEDIFVGHEYKLSSIFYDFSSAGKGFFTEVPQISSRHLACLVFTSGSTGKPVANEKYWGDLVKGILLVRKRYGFSREDYLVATVPAQHLYGLETTVLLPMMSQVSVYGGMPFFSEDIRKALTLCGRPASLISTPLHLRVCAQAGIAWPSLAKVISATSPLSVNDASTAEMAFSVELREIYGSTESGAIASRRTTKEKAWTLYEGVKLDLDGQTVSVIAAHLPHRPVLADAIDKMDDVHFLMHGRSTDMIKIAGKRASLADLNLKLNAVEGVDDGVIMPLPSKSDNTLRLCAIIVAAELDVSEMISALRAEIDPVFLPRSVYKVDTLPRSETGKLPYSEMIKLLQKLMVRC